MGLLDRWLARQEADHPVPVAPTLTLVKRAGAEELEVVGESHYQQSLWELCGGNRGERVEQRITGVLVPEPTNLTDPNAIRVEIDGRQIGYLPADVAVSYLPGLLRFMSAVGGHLALDGVIAGGGYDDDGPARLQVKLEHDPADFGVTPEPEESEDLDSVE